MSREMRDCATLDSNVLLYKELEADDPKGRRAGALIEACAPTGVLAVQAHLEFFPSFEGSALID